MYLLAITIFLNIIMLGLVGYILDIIFKYISKLKSHHNTKILKTIVMKCRKRQRPRIFPPSLSGYGDTCRVT